KQGKAQHWNLARLSSRENPLVLFTLSAQAAAGAFGLAFLGGQLGLAGFATFAQSAVYAPLAILCLLMVAFGLFMSTMHLGKPHRFYRGFNNLRHSPVSREGLGIAIFMGALGLHVLFSLPANSLFQSLFAAVFGTGIDALISPERAAMLARAFGILAMAGSAGGLYYMYRCYRIKARPFWNHWQVGTAFVGSMLALGALVAGAAMVATLAYNGESWLNVATVCAALMCSGMLVEGIGHTAHAKAMGTAEHEGGASYYVQTTTFGKTYQLRNTLLGLNLLAACGLLASMLVLGTAGAFALLGLAAVGATLIATSLIGRALFYVLVIPTTMPGAFFWKNKGFEEHARDIGLANMPQVGVVPLKH
ncbi:MAG TPA: DmsC/YnfH family molybdoenzyme membrane anchor subunit, partial [Ramlibacter sp.]|nr:DmsC/YnfH family molybdoenzyme membrane anchor subunit [Ramlibacter sp.]